MTNRFVVALDAGEPGQQDLITEHFRAKGYRWWHWVDNVWLLADVPLGASAQAIWRDLDAIPALTGKPILVLGFNAATTHGGRLPQDAWAWLSRNWGVVK